MSPARGISGPALSLFIVCLATSVPGAPPQAPFNKQKVAFKSGPLTLAGYVYKPDGDGPFPTLVWNHGSERNPLAGPQFDSVAAIFAPAGYAVMAPIRRGQGDSEGDYIQDRIQAALRESGPASAEHLMVQLMESEQLADQLAGLAFAKMLPFVDTTRLVRRHPDVARR